MTFACDFLTVCVVIELDTRVYHGTQYNCVVYCMRTSNKTVSIRILACPTEAAVAFLKGPLHIPCALKFSWFSHFTFLMVAHSPIVAVICVQIHPSRFDIPRVLSHLAPRHNSSVAYIQRSVAPSSRGCVAIRAGGTARLCNNGSSWTDGAANRVRIMTETYPYGLPETCRMITQDPRRCLAATGTAGGAATDEDIFKSTAAPVATAATKPAPSRQVPGMVPLHQWPVAAARRQIMSAACICHGELSLSCLIDIATTCI